MSVITVIKSLVERATRLEAGAEALRGEALALRGEASGLYALLVGEDAAVPVAAPSPSSPEEVGAQAAPPKSNGQVPKSNGQVPAMPTRDEIRAKATKYGVDVDDLLPLGKKPTQAAKEEALRRIVKAKKTAEEAAASAPPVSADGEDGSVQAQ